MCCCGGPQQERFRSSECGSDLWHGQLWGPLWESIEGTENEFRCFTGSTRKVRKNMLERLRVEHGQKRVAMLTAAHVKANLGDMSDRPGCANSLLKALRVLLRHAVDMGLIHDNPARNVRKLPVRSEGLHSWTENEVEMFEVTHRPVTRAHLSRRQGSAIGSATVATNLACHIALRMAFARPVPHVLRMPDAHPSRSNPSLAIRR